MKEPGVYEQRNAGHLVIGEFEPTSNDRAERIAQWLRTGVDVKIAKNMRGAMWSKLVVNCAVTTIGAIAGQTMRAYIASPTGRALFMKTYSEALAVARAAGVTPERTMINPVPPMDEHEIDLWIDEILAAYGDLKASMLQDFERGRETEIDYINGYVVDAGRKLGVATPANASIVKTVRAITRADFKPDPAHLARILRD